MIPDWIVKPNTILCGYRGSIAHGTYVSSTDPDSIDDVDFMSIVVAPKEHYIGLTPWGSKGTKETFIDEFDLVEYEVSKYIRLLLKCNPNVLSLLWGNPERYQLITKWGQYLIDNREAFASRAAFDSFYGYCQSQISHAGKIGGRGFRGKKRSQLVERYGYDTKNAAHCIRLARMGAYFLRTGELQIDRSKIDADELLAIKKGAWSFDRFVQEATNIIAEMRHAYSVSPLPPEPNYKLAEDVCMEIIKATVLATDSI